MWFGGFNNQLWIDDGKLSNIPTIEKLAKDFDIFQNSPYYGEWNQQKTMTYGQVRDLLKEIAGLLKEAI